MHADPVRLENDDVQLAQAGLHVRFKFDGKDQIGMNDGEASGGQQVMKSLVLLIGLLKSEDGSGGFVFIDEPFAHLDIRNIQLVGEFLKNTDAQYLMTTPLTHNTDVYDPSELTLITSKKKKDTQWAQPIFVLQRRVDAGEDRGVQTRRSRRARGTCSGGTVALPHVQGQSYAAISTRLAQPSTPQKQARRIRPKIPSRHTNAPAGSSDCR